MNTAVDKKATCYHCGEDSTGSTIRSGELVFCCTGCKTVYHILQKNNLCNYYQLNERPGNSLKAPVRADKFAFLDEPSIAQRLIQFSDAAQTHVRFYLPQIHCSSCLYLLEQLHKLHAGVLSSRINFPAREITIVFDRQLSLRQLAELLTSLGYEPYISLNDLQQERVPAPRGLWYRLGIAGFCFANIMLLSFPEYLGFDGAQPYLQQWFRGLSLVLAIPVLLYCAQPFFIAAWKGLRHRFLNIDAPVALAIVITFLRSCYEIGYNISGGYFDSMSGIVFFMLLGRVLQHRTYDELSFDRDYTAYFPLSVTRVDEQGQKPVLLPEVKVNDTLLIHHDEIIPADGILTKGTARIDYSFVTGESLPVVKEMGELVYAGGRQTGTNIEILTIREVVQSYLTRLWNADHSDKADAERHLFVHRLSRHFTWIVLALAFIGALYWSRIDGHRAWNVITTVLIVACPCALLLSHTFTNGNILRILAKWGLYLRHARVIEDIADIDHIVFDKTGTLTTAIQDMKFEGEMLTGRQWQMVAAVAGQSVHPLSKLVVQQLAIKTLLPVAAFEEMPGAGIRGIVAGTTIAFLAVSPSATDRSTKVGLWLNDQLKGHFVFSNHYRQQVPDLARQLQSQYQLSILSGDTDGEAMRLRQLFGPDTLLRFRQQPQTKQQYIETLQAKGQKVMMVGDGLNDAGALQQSKVGIAVAENTHSFTPACDAIMDAGSLPLLPRFIRLCKLNQTIILVSFILSLLYNVIGLYFALQGTLSPLVAAILMPASSLSILLLTFGCSSLAGHILLGKAPLNQNR
jgi:P-type Cu+ transporter